uniref:VWFA domain-containing protein n=1 Tax=Heterorhabditis bacteriophora TaxID=37862 RepID=A0A1I7WLS3_HETBA
MLIKQCEGGPRHTSKTETTTVHFVKTATDSKGRHLIPNPHFTSYGDQHLNDHRKSSAEGSGDGVGKVGIYINISNRVPAVFELQDQKRNIESQLPSRNILVVILTNSSDFTDKSELEKAITAISFMSGTTYTNEALMKAINVFQVTTSFYYD